MSPECCVEWERFESRYTYVTPAPDGAFEIRTTEAKATKLGGVSRWCCSSCGRLADIALRRVLDDAAAAVSAKEAVDHVRDT